MPISATENCPGLQPACATSTQDGRPAESDLIILAAARHGQTSLATNIAYNVARAWRHEVQADGQIATVNGGRVGFFRSKCRPSNSQPVFFGADRDFLEQDPARRDHASRSR